jgi:hypothetical protein
MAGVDQTQLVLDQLTKLNTNIQLMFNQMQMQMSFFAMNQVQPLFPMNQAHPIFAMNTAQVQYQGNPTNAPQVYQGNPTNAPQVPTSGCGQKPVKLTEVVLVDSHLIDLHTSMTKLRDSGRYHRSFMRKYPLILKFKQLHGHVRVTASMHKVLSAWVKNQRTNLGSCRRHRGPLVGKPFHVNLLNEIGIIAYDDDEDAVDLRSIDSAQNDEE